MKSFVYFGTPYVARDTLSYLIQHGYVPSLVVTAPDAPRGRGLALTPSETKVLAASHDIPVITPKKITQEVIEEIQRYAADYAIVVAYGEILPRALLASFPEGALNIHYSLLPKYRGASPVEAVLLAGETETGVSIQKMVYELDAGDVLAQKAVAILPEETTRELRPRLITMGAQLLIETLPRYLSGALVGVPQDAAFATVCRKIDKSEGELSLHDDARTNWNKYRAYAESPGTYFFMERNGKRIRVKIRTARFDHDTFMPERVVPEGKKEMSYADLMRGQ